jgi:O-antigen/teichoic acid export membrane protein
MMKYTTFKNSVRNSPLAVDSFWALVGNVASRGLGLLGAILVARILGKHVYGEYGMIRNTLISIAIFSTFGLGYTATKYVANYRIDFKEKIRSFCRYSVRCTLIVSGAMGVSLLLTSNYVASELLNAPSLSNSLRFVAVWIVFNALTTTQIGILSGFGFFKQMAKINTIVGVVTFLSTFILTYYYQLQGALVALVISQVINWILNYYALESELSKPEYQSTQEVQFKSILLFSLPITLQEGLYSITSWLGYLLLIRLSSYGELGLYSAAMQWSAVILFIPGILRNVILSHMSNSNGSSGYQSKILKPMLLVSFVSTVFPFLIILAGSKYIGALYGSTFNDLHGVLSVSVLTTIFTSMSNVYVQAYMAVGDNWTMLLFRFIRDVGILMLAYVFILRTNNQHGALILSYCSLLMNILFLSACWMFYPKQVPQQTDKFLN